MFSRASSIVVCLAVCGLTGLWLLPAASTDDKLELKSVPPKTPQEAKKTFQLVDGFGIELVASEPNVVDPVAFAFDEDGRLFVAEMHAYPNKGVGTGKVSSGKIKLLEDRDGDGFYEKSVVYADGLRLPTSVMPYRGGLLVANAPDIVYLEDTDGDGKSDKRTILYTGFGLNNIQQMVNSLQWGFDNWVHACNGRNPTSVKSPQKPQMPPLTLRGRSLRFKPDVPGSIQPTSGGGQYGESTDDWGRWFTATNSQHLRHIVLPDRYLRRNPLLPVSTVTINIPDHGPSCKVFRISPFEAWRVERTRRRKSGPRAKSLPSTELVPGGYSTSTCSPIVYRANAFPAEFRGDVFVCDPANNLIHQDQLRPNGASFRASRAHKDREFLASTDNWFRPVFLNIGPDGSMYVADFYREVIETPLSLPDDIKKAVNLQSRRRGRIWRIVHTKSKNLRQPQLSKSPAKRLVKHLDDPNVWWRMTAQRLIVEKADPSAIPELRKLVRSAKSPQGRMHALWTLQGLDAVQADDVVRLLNDKEAGVRENALQVAEPLLAGSADVRKAALALAHDPSPRVRFQLAFSVGEVSGDDAFAAMAKIARDPRTDSWTEIALLSSARKSAAGLLAELTKDGKVTSDKLLSRLAFMVGADGGEKQLARVLNSLVQSGKPESWQLAVLEGLGSGLRNSRKSLGSFWEKPPTSLRDAVTKTESFFESAQRKAKDDKAPLNERINAVRLLAFGPFKIAEPGLTEMLSPQQPAKLQLAAVQSLSAHVHPKVADVLIARWRSYSPSLQREAAEALFARQSRVLKLLDAVENKKVPAAQLETSRVRQLRSHPNAAIRQRAKKLFTSQSTPRNKIIAAFRPALKLKGDAKRGAAVFKKTCSVCHRLNDIGTEVGADLKAALQNKTAEAILIDVLDPNREIDSRFIEYLVTTKSGRVVTGLIAAETGSSLTLRRAEKAEDTILRSQIDVIRATSKSLMPEGLEKQLTPQKLADLIQYLLESK